MKENLDKYNPQNLTNIAWAYAVTNVTDPSAFDDKFIEACMRKEDLFSSEGLFQLHQWQLWQE